MKFNPYFTSIPFIVLFCLCNLTSKAQLTTFVLTPNNVDQIVSNLLYSYEEHIDISTYQLKNFIHASQEGFIYNPEITAPIPSIAGMTYESITYNLPDLPEDASIRVQYIGFNSGEQGELHVSGQNSVQMPNVFSEKYLYLFSIFVKSRQTGISKSGDFIIIEENPAIRDHVIGPCGCPEPGLILPPTNFSEIETDLDNILLDNDKLKEDVRYKVDFESSTSNGYYYLTKRKGDVPLVYEVSASEDCIKNVRLPENEFLFYGVQPEEERAYLGFSVAPELGLRMNWLNPSIDGRISVTECGHSLSEDPALRTQSKSATLLTLKNYPNPSTGRSTLQYQLTRPDAVTLILTDAMGQQLRVLKREKQQEAGSYFFDLDLKDLPNGLYQCQLKTTKNIESIRLLKVE